MIQRGISLADYCGGVRLNNLSTLSGSLQEIEKHVTKWLKMATDEKKEKN